MDSHAHKDEEGESIGMLVASHTGEGYKNIAKFICQDLAHKGDMELEFEILAVRVDWAAKVMADITSNLVWGKVYALGPILDDLIPGDFIVDGLATSPLNVTCGRFSLTVLLSSS